MNEAAAAIRGDCNRARRVWMAIGWAALIFVASSIPGSSTMMRPWFPNFDKVAHFGVYVVLGYLILRAGRNEWLRPVRLRWFLMALAIGWIYGASDELHQAFVPDRFRSLADWIADAAGVLTGQLCHMWVNRR